jgi:hypothetical protein
MKKSQRARFLALSAQASRTAAEQTEFETLSALAAKHPDASKDTDDAAAPAADAKPTMTVQGLMQRFTAATSAKETLVRENAAFQQRIAALESGNVGAVTLATVLVALGLKPTDFAGKDAAAIAAAIKAPGATDATAKDSQITTLTTERDTATAQLVVFGAALGIKPGELVASAENLAKFGVKDDDDFKKLTAAQKNEAVARAAVDFAIAARTLTQVSALGFNAAELPAADTKDKTTAQADLHKQYDDLVAAGKNTEAAKFWNANFEAMFAAPATSKN